jgi:hypothetical protein
LTDEQEFGGVSGGIEDMISRNTGAVMRSLLKSVQTKKGEHIICG